VLDWRQEWLQVVPKQFLQGEKLGDKYYNECQQALSEL
jgi:hypothetical protein